VDQPVTAWSFIKDEARHLLTWGLALVLLLVSAGAVLVAAVLILVMTAGRVEYRGAPAPAGPDHPAVASGRSGPEPADHPAESDLLEWVPRS
jgi:hypothetical protein